MLEGRTAGGSEIGCDFLQTLTSTDLIVTSVRLKARARGGKRVQKEAYIGRAGIISGTHGLREADGADLQCVIG